MSDSLAQSLPTGTDVAFDAPSRPLYFGPIGSAEGNPVGGTTTAYGTLDASADNTLTTEQCASLCMPSVARWS